MSFKNLWVTESEDEYHARKDCISASVLKQMLKSPMHYQYFSEFGIKATPTMEIGKLIHVAILEPERLREKMVVAPKCDKRTIVGKLIYQKFSDSLVGDELIVDEKKMDMLTGILGNVKRYEMLSSMLKGSVFEVSGYWTDPKTGKKCKMRADALSEKGWVFDIKKTVDASRYAFERSIWKYRYDLSAAWYLEGFKQITGINPKGFAFIAIEDKPPYAVYVYTLDQAALETGQTGGENSEGYMHAVNRIIECEKTKLWPMPQQKAELISVPSYVL